MREAVVVHLLDEVAQHLLGHVEVGDDAVLQRADRGDRPGRAAEHALGLDPDGVHLARALVDRDDRRLGEHDAAAAHVDERVGCAEVDSHLAAAETADVPQRLMISQKSNDNLCRAIAGHDLGLTPAVPLRGQTFLAGK